MLVTVSALTQVMDNRIGYVEDARANGLGDDKYFNDMEHTLRNNLKKLNDISFNKKLIAKYENKVNTLFS